MARPPIPKPIQAIVWARAKAHCACCGEKVLAGQAEIDAMTAALAELEEKKKAILKESQLLQAGLDQAREAAALASQLLDPPSRYSKKPNRPP